MQLTQQQNNKALKTNFSINIGGQVLDLSQPCVMSIINVTPDSFWHGSRAKTDKDIAQSVELAISEGASIIDIGGYSSRPSADDVPVDKEIERVLNALKVIKKSFGDFSIPVSIDTFRSEVVEAVTDYWGAVVVNDISAGDDDSNMLKMVADRKLPYIAMHKKGTPKTMGSLNSYNDIVGDLLNYFAVKVKEIANYGIDDLILDIGFGFAKNAQQNFELIRRYSEFSVMGFPTLAGISRKRMIWKTLDVDIADALNGTSALHWELLRGGASILRVHDTKAASEVIKLYKSVFYELS